MCSIGTAPRVRGTRHLPAASARPRSVQPRVCGEHPKASASYPPDMTTAPRVRGTPSGRWYPHASPSVQPRVCGEHVHAILMLTALFGTAPRVRGTRSSRGAHGPVPRYSPACAGNTLEVIRLDTVFPVQPRVCGEHAFKPLARLERIGTAPRVRGTRALGTAGAMLTRYSPACAGNTCGGPRDPPFSSVQPRVCGEHVPVARDLLPRVRYSPACAGNTHVHPLADGGAPVQPRVCGEHSSYKMLTDRDLWVERNVTNVMGEYCPGGPQRFVPLHPEGLSAIGTGESSPKRDQSEYAPKAERHLDRAEPGDRFANVPGNRTSSGTRRLFTPTTWDASKARQPRTVSSGLVDLLA